MHRVVVLALDGVYPFELGIPGRIFGIASDHYEVVTCSVDGAPVRARGDFDVAVRHGPEALDTADTLVIPPFDLSLVLRQRPAPGAPSSDDRGRTGSPTDPPNRERARRHGPILDPSTPPDGFEVRERPPEEVTAALARIRPGTRLVSICTASFLLAALGMLDGRRAATHWSLSEELRRLFPRVDVDADVLFVHEGDVLTSAGAASGVDACLHLIREDHGSALANRVARSAVVPPWRDGGQAQYIERPVPEEPATGTGPTRQWVLERLHLPLTLAEMAEHARMSPRTFARRFQQETGTSPGRWLTDQRLRRARHLLESTDLTVDRIATDVGFATAASLRQHLHATIGVPPLTYRRTFRPHTPDPASVGS